MMLRPTIAELTKGEINRYELAIATAKCARAINNEYVKQREEAEKNIEDKKSEKAIAAFIDKDIRDKKAVENAVQRIYRGEFNVIIPEETGEEHLK